MEKPKTPFIYSVVFKIGVFALVLAALFIWVGSIGVTSFKNQNDILYNTRRDKDISIFNAIINKSSESVASFAQDYGIWDDMVDYISDPITNAEFAEINLTAAAMNTYKTDAMRVYNASGKLVIAVDSIPDETADFVVSGDVQELFNSSRTIHFFAKCENSAMEIYGATVHPSDDSERQTPIRGYIFAIKHINQTYMDEVGSQVQNHLEVIDPDKTDEYSTAFDIKTGHIAFKYDLKDINDITVAQFYVTDEISAIKQTSKMQNGLLSINFSLYTVTAVAFALLIFKWVIRPLDRITQGLDCDDKKSLLDLHKTAILRSEYGRLANLVILHKAQEKELETEKANVEHQVKIRTEELNEEHTRLKASIESLNVGYFITDIHDKILMINQRAKTLLQAQSTKDELHQSKWTIERVEASLKAGVALAEKLKQCREAQKIIDLEEVDYGHSILKIYIAPIIRNVNSQSITIGTVFLLEDVTEKKMLDRSKDEFFSIASHELRTPLTAIMGNAKMIMDYYSDQLKDQSLHEMISDIHESSVRLIDIVSEFLDVSRIEQGRMVFSPEYVDVTAVLESVVYEMKSMLQSKNLYLKLDNMTHEELPKIYADPARVKQVLYNIIGNAVKFTESGGITISAIRHGEFLKVIVHDTGSGISDKSRNLLFRKFQQASENILTRDVTRGTGLGLYISKLMVEKMGGIISLDESKLGAGSTFSFTLPLNKVNYSTLSQLPNRVEGLEPNSKQ